MMKLAAISMILLVIGLSLASIVAAVDSGSEQGSMGDEAGTLGPAPQGMENDPDPGTPAPEVEKSSPGGEAGSQDNLSWPQED